MKEAEEKDIYTPLEIYGQIMQYLHVENEEKNLQFLTNEIFKAADKDLQSDKKTLLKDKASHKEIQDYNKKATGSTRSLDTFLKHYVSEMNIEDNKKEEYFNALKKVIEPEYRQLKWQLNEVRVLGVGKDMPQKLAAVAGIAYRVISPILVLGGLAISAFAMFQGIKSQSEGFRDMGIGNYANAGREIYAGQVFERAGTNVFGASVAMAALGFGPSIQLNKIRKNMKNALKGDEKKTFGKKATEILRDKKLYKKTNSLEKI